MASLYRDADRNRWLVSFRIPGESRRTKRSFVRKTAARSFRSKVEDALDHARLGNSAKLRALLEPERKLSLDDIVERYLRAVRKGQDKRTEREERQRRNRLTKALEAMRVAKVADVTLDGAARFLSQMQADGKATKTRREVALILRSFTRYLHREELIERDPLVWLELPSSEPEIERRAACFDELVSLIAAAPVRAVAQFKSAYPNARGKMIARQKRAGKRRALVYAWGWSTGMRIDEIRQVSWRRLDLDAGEIRFERGRRSAEGGSKSGRGDVQVLPPWLVARLRRLRGLASVQRGGPPDPDDKVVHVETNFVRDALRPDLEYAGIPYDSDRGRLDMHALSRTSCVNHLIELGVGDDERRAYVRHRPADVHARAYAKLQAAPRARLHEVAAMFPDPFTKGGEHSGEHEGAPEVHGIGHADRKERARRRAEPGDGRQVSTG